MEKQGCWAWPPLPSTSVLAAHTLVFSEATLLRRQPPVLT